MGDDEQEERDSGMRLPPEIEEATLLTEYPQPSEAIDLLADSGNRDHQVLIGGRYCNFDTYCHGFLRAANVVVDSIVKPRTQGTWSDYSAFGESSGYAALYLYRHWLELRLKELILACGSRPRNIHSIDGLWRRFKELDKRGCDNATDEGRLADRVADTTIGQFDHVDRDAQAFRYPTDTEGNQIAAPRLCLDLVQLKETMGWLNLYLEGWSTCLYEMCQAEHEYHEYEQ